MRRIAPARGATFTQPLPKWSGPPLRARPAWIFELRSCGLHHNRSQPGLFCGQRSPWPRYGKKTAEMDCSGPSVIDGFQSVSSSSGQQIGAGAIVSGASHGRKLLAKQRLIAGDVRRARIRHAGHQHPLHTSQLRVAQGVRCLRKPWSIWSMK